jgi:hypothetical protein
MLTRPGWGNNGPGRSSVFENRPGGQNLDQKGTKHRLTIIRQNSGYVPQW